MGRPSGYTQEIADRLCEWIADGKSLREFCSADDTPSKASIFKWLNENKEFSDKYARAREAAADSHFDDVNFYAESAVYGTIDPAAARVAIDAKKWTAGRMQPKKYGDRITHAGDAENPVAISRIELVAPAITASTDKKDSDDSKA